MIAARGREAGSQSLRRGFFIAGRAVDLTGQIQAGNPIDLQRGRQDARIDMIIFDRIARRDDLGRFEPDDRPDEVGWTSAGSEVEMPLG